MICHGELVLSSLFALCSSRIFLAITLNSKNSAGIKAIILLRKEKKQRLKLIGGLEAFKKFGGLYSKCKKNPRSAVSQPTGAKKVKARTLCVIRESI